MAHQHHPTRGLRELALFAGAGGGILGGKLLGWRCVCAVEIDPYAQQVLLARQEDKTLDPFPIWDNVQTFDGTRWRGAVDVVSGGFPCTDISAAGRGAGITGAKSSLWREMARIVREVRPRYVFVENSPVLTSRGLGSVLGDLASLGYDAAWCVLGAHHAGAPHRRDRIWILATDATNPDRDQLRQQSEPDARGSGSPLAAISGAAQHVADSYSQRQQQPQGNLTQGRLRPCNCGQEMANTYCAQCERDQRPERITETHAVRDGVGWWSAEPNVG